MRERERRYIGDAVGIALTAYALIHLSSFAFSRQTRRKIWRRAGGRSELTGYSHMKLECAHYDHDRSNPDYDNPDNGRLLTVQEHLEDHLMYRDTAVDNRGLLANGLTPEANEWAIKKIQERLPDFVQPALALD